MFPQTDSQRILMGFQDLFHWIQHEVSSTIRYPKSFLNIEAVAQRCPVKKVFLEISQNSQENTCARVSFLIKLEA